MFSSPNKDEVYCLLHRTLNYVLEVLRYVSVFHALRERCRLTIDKMNVGQLKIDSHLDFRTGTFIKCTERCLKNRSTYEHVIKLLLLCY